MYIGSARFFSLSSWLPAANSFGFSSGEFYEGDAGGEVGVDEFAGLQLAAEDSLEGAEALLRLGAGECDDGAELGGEVVGLALEVAGILREEHDDGAFGAALADEIDEGFRATFFEHLAGFVEDEQVAEAAEATGHGRVGLVEEEGADGIEQNEGNEALQFFG